VSATPHADLLSVAATLARLSFFAGGDADQISDRTHENIVRLALRVKDAADAARNNIAYLERVAFASEVLCDATVARVDAATDGDDARIVLYATVRPGTDAQSLIGAEVVVSRSVSPVEVTQ
jgi:hypothetical protein